MISPAELEEAQKLEEKPLYWPLRNCRRFVSGLYEVLLPDGKWREAVYSRLVNEWVVNGVMVQATDILSIRMPSVTTKREEVHPLDGTKVRSTSARSKYWL